MNESKNLLGCQVFQRSSIPNGWECEALGDRIELAYGRSLPEGHRRPGLVTVYGSNGPVGMHDHHFVEAPGLLVGRKGTVGAVRFAEGAYWPIDTVYYAIPLKGDDLQYLYYLLQYLPLDRLNAATGVPGLSRRDAYALLGVFPPKAEQIKIAAVLSMLDKEIDKVCSGVVIQKALRISVFTDGIKGDIKNTSENPLSASYAKSLIALKTSLMDAIFTGSVSASSLQVAVENAL